MKLKPIIITVLLLGLISAATPCFAEWGLTLKAGYYLAPNWADTYDVIYDNGGELSYGFEINYLFSQNWELGVSLEMISGDGERVWQDDGGQWIPSGESVSFDMMPITVFTRWYFLAESTVSPFIGIGLGFNQFEETDSDSESGIGYLLSGGVNVSFTESLSFLLEGEMSTYPEVIGDGDLSQFFNEDDIGGMTIRAGLKYTF